MIFNLNISLLLHQIPQLVQLPLPPRYTLSIKETHHQQSNNGRIVGVLISTNTEQI